MRLVVADTSPLFYLLSINHIDLLLQLFGTVFIPDGIYAMFQSQTRSQSPGDPAPAALNTARMVFQSQTRSQSPGDADCS